MDTLTKQFQEVTLQKKLQTGIVYDLDLLLHKSKATHVETPSRITSIIQHLGNEDLLEKSCALIQKVQPAPEDLIIKVHGIDYKNHIDKLWKKDIKKTEINIGDTYFNEHTTQVVYKTVGAVLAAVDQVMQNLWKNAFCIVRPPGHHSGEAETCTGFCFFNNVVIGAKYAIEKYKAKRVAIVDWDIHFGDGTFHLVQNESNILFISLHRFDNGKFYPGDAGSSHNTGKRPGFCINIPWNFVGNGDFLAAGDNEYIYAFETIIMPILREFQPDVILVSSGLDSAKGDPLGEGDISKLGYFYMTTQLTKITQGKVIVALEGGYNLQSLAWGSEAIVRGLLGDNTFKITQQYTQADFQKIRNNLLPNYVGLEAIKTCIGIHQQYWPCLIKDKQAQEITEIVQSNIAKNLLFVPLTYILKSEVILKPIDAQEYQFYQDIMNNKNNNSDLQAQILSKYLIQCNGTKKIELQEYQELENLFHNKEFGTFIEIQFQCDQLYNQQQNEIDQNEAANQKKGKKQKPLKPYDFEITQYLYKNKQGIPGKSWKKFNNRDKELLDTDKIMTMSQYEILIERFLKSNDEKEIIKKAYVELINMIDQLIQLLSKCPTIKIKQFSFFGIIDNIKRSYLFRIFKIKQLTKQDAPISQPLTYQKTIDGLNQLNQIITKFKHHVSTK